MGNGAEQTVLCCAVQVERHTEQQAVLYVAGFRSESAVSLVSPPDSGE